VTEGHERITDDVAAYVLGSLEGAERERVEAHMATCAVCKNLLAEYEAVATALPIGLEPVAPPPEAWRTIRTAARERRQPRSRWASSVPLLERLRFVRWPAVAALLALFVMWNVALERELTRRSPGPAPGPEVEALSRRPGRVIILAGTGAPQAAARIFVAVDGGGHLAVSGLTALPRERAYQLWFIQNWAPALSAATFRVDPSGRAWVKVVPPASLDNVRMIVITEEPASGSMVPTGSELLVARPWP
jgi:anti-sigma-K factor RskA